VERGDPLGAEEVELDIEHASLGRAGVEEGQADRRSIDH
jgi:hypothetical protein